MNLHIGLVLVALLGTFLAAANECPNRYYCHTAEIKYRSFDAMAGFYLNSTNHVIKSFPAVSNQSCIQECVRIPQCKSANHHLPVNASDMICDLIDGNRWSNASLLQERKNSTHFFVMSACASNPCKNGATCISLDQEASYKCACKDSNFTTTIHGTHCETLKVAEKTAQVYYKFDSQAPIDRITSKTFSKSGDIKILSVPDRKSPVLYLPGKSGSYGSFSGYSSVCHGYTLACRSSPNNGLSVSFWFKLSKRGQEKVVQSVCSTAHKITLAASTRSISSYSGFEVLLNGCTSNAATVTVRDQTSRCIATWGNGTDPSLQTWTHFMFTYSYVSGLIIYIDGVAVKQAAVTSVTTAASYHSHVDFGYQGAGDFEAYIDRFAAWYNLLTPADVSFLYNHGKKEESFSQN
ncbi:uncharacterized protein LOC135692609 [Rhopilema esculentum]|uniref:uncharacterized protein LOC135692609 n=1 Tax=Rhopilema esculentum TaxID=499914 RepID=UPI0031D5BF3C